MQLRLSPLKVLLIEDSAADAELVMRALRALDVEIEHARVATANALRRSLAEFGPDVVLSDFSMPGFSGQEALEIVRERLPHVPFLFVSGTIGEELAIQALQRGAIDYVLKDNLRRLPSAVERALGIARDGRDRQRMEQALRESEERFRSIVENSRDWIWENDGNSRITYSNGAVTAILGYQPEELVGTLAVEHMHPEDRAEAERRLPALLAEGKGWYRWRLRWRHRNGSIRVLESTAIPQTDADGHIAGFRGVDQDVTERLQQEAKIRQLARFHAVLSAFGNVVLRASDHNELLHDACRVAVEQGGFKAAGIGVRDSDDMLRVVASHGDPDVLSVVAPSEPMPINAPSTYHRHPGILAFRENRRIAVQDFTSSDVPEDVRDDMARIGIKSEIALPIGAEPWGLLALFSGPVQVYDDEEIGLLQRLTSELDYAVTFLAKSERLEYLAYNNPVTGLPNRSAFREQVAPLLCAGPMLVAVLDVERLTHINESRGRAFGDALLREIGRRLHALAGTTGFVAHPEADQFLLSYPVTGPLAAELVQLEARLEEFTRESFQVEDEDIHVGLHGGVAIAPEHGGDGETLERNALAALAEGSRRGVRLHPFSEELRGRAMYRVSMERDLRRALEEGEFELHYQPKFHAASQRLVGAEALLRWHRPEHGMVSPAEFIPVLEDTGLIVPVGRWLMRDAIATALAWRMHTPTFRIAVNVSARELRHSRFLDDCRAVLGPHAADPVLDVEVTESLLMDDIEQSIRLLYGLRDLGCRVSIDDFGTGYSSLNYLARLPVDEIKIDQSFTALIAHSPETMSLVTNIISLAHSLSLSVVAEGVEEEEQAKLLRLLRCDVLQGYLLGRPMTAAAFEEKMFGADTMDRGLRASLP